ncbi:hypothetical protein ACH5RR_009981 [Cinchona calisaya]|uniref:Uncharacterized protein n=1 Tax=Cinchona calisaya TaxID=153742 RepID=A0ABD3AHB1_9GENT
MRQLLQFMSKKSKINVTNASSSSLHLNLFSRRLHAPTSQSPSFGIAFDIDGVLLRGDSPIGGSPQALKRLYYDSATYSISSLKIPYVFLTNGGGVPESKRAEELGKQLGVNILPLQVIQGHTPFRELVKRYENDLIVAAGKGEPANVMSEYGFKNVLSLDEYASCFENIDPLAQYKKWTKMRAVDRQMALTTDPCSQRVRAVFIVSDPVDWSRDIQVLCDILRTGGLPGREIAHQPPIYFANDDLAYQALFPAERLGMGAFRIALESIFNRIHPNNMEYTSFGKPSPFVFKNAENVLTQVLQSAYNNVQAGGETPPLKSLYMIGDNPSVDVKGARQAGHPWFSILTRTGVFKGKENHAEYPADVVVDCVEEAVDYILRKECIS